ncbi:MAG: hypothetical protein CGU28_06445 [Candidatus Dactylopiibacterium carminicum]|uniref:DUF2782 domain-containing protein n=1 Tax=Candidatus Dactylopiibacterium carminicum TaxID=857335 RepID=A0A272EWL3_9RHOO|nr:DUF2782 domain-containing protein [Candidatus Dactylopiibacterium carminicum]KAF7599939.1 DUF2782 domain-containing protein [Candidatus Dactylopiibacterium carminicum]PAS94481.1 MAG: hypothetical protein CGU29_04015 [Candidatus Dactylopiibacterium carminicum]PAS97035.1 MAG: hypothetical protein CGU28_06445 [Candidatus Dactylopiibacterium carminicum]PAS99942.1 MAG: hypothetical protein BSR46_04960 [Candidatus Dactylopiibacterium carminicum]
MKKHIPLLLALLLGTAPVLAQTTRQEVPEPPALGELPGADAPDVTIRNRGGDRVEEYRRNGQLYMIKVTPQVGPAYYLVARDRDGGFERVNDLDRARTMTQWILLQW